MKTIAQKFAALVLFTGIFLVSQVSLAQEGGFIINDQTKDDSGEESVVLENNNYVGQSPSKDENKDINKPTVKPQNTNTSTKDKEKTRPQGEAAKKDEDSVLSFNILYYIFQKFKFSEVTDE